MSRLLIDEHHTTSPRAHNIFLLKLKNSLFTFRDNLLFRLVDSAFKTNCGFLSDLSFLKYFRSSRFLFEQLVPVLQIRSLERTELFIVVLFARKRLTTHFAHQVYIGSEIDGRSEVV